MTDRQQRWAKAAVTLTYVVVTVGESILAPILPVAAPELQLGETAAGRLLGLLAITAGIGNLVGGWLLSRFGARTSSLTAIVLTSIGAGLAVVDGGVMLFAVAHGLLGLGAGVFFAGGIYSIGVLADPERRGRAMGMFGIAYSLALALAAGMVALVGPDTWRAVFAVAAALGVVTVAVLWRVELPGSPGVPPGARAGGLRRLVVPVTVGGIAAVAQFGLVAFVPTFAVDSWAYSASVAATVLLIGRVLSIPGKAIAGRLADRCGAMGAVRRVTAVLVASGALWLMAPVAAVGAAAATVFAAAASAMFPVANVVAVERFGSRGGLLGVFRSAQMAVAGLSVWLIGAAGAAFGLQTALLIGVVALAVPLPFLRSRVAVA